MAFQVVDVPEAGRFELLDEGAVVGIADYGLDGDVVVVPHTEIAPDRRGEGLGALLVGGMLDQIRASGRTVRPRCWYVAQYLGEHPEAADIVER
jgi:uncharacterized protein